MYEQEKKVMREKLQEELRMAERKISSLKGIINKTNNLILNLTPENMTQHSRIE